MPRPIFTVFGATGKQGGSVVRTLLTHPDLAGRYSIRAVTRNPSSESAKAIAKSADVSKKHNPDPDGTPNFELVAADLDKPESVKEAVDRASAVFGMTDFWATADAARETKQGKAIVDAVAAAKPDLFIWSSLPSFRGLQEEAVRSGAALKEEVPKVPHFESKAVVEQYIRDEYPSLPTIVVHPAVFWENLARPPFGPSQEEVESGKKVLKLSLPFDPETTVIPFFTPRDTGTYVAALLQANEKEPKRVQGKAIPIFSQLLTVPGLAEEVKKAGKGREVTVERIPMAKFVAPIPEAVRSEFESNMRLIEKPGYYGSPGAAAEARKWIDQLLEDYDAAELSSAADILRWD